MQNLSAIFLAVPLKVIQVPFCNKAKKISQTCVKVHLTLELEFWVQGPFSARTSVLNNLWKKIIWFTWQYFCIRMSITGVLCLIQFVIFNPWKVPWNWIDFFQKCLVVSLGLLYHLIRRKNGRLTNEAFASNLVVSSKE